MTEVDQNRNVGTRATVRIVCFAEAVGLSAFVAWFIWQLQALHPRSWLVFPVWLLGSFVAHRDTPKTVGWRGDNLLAAARKAVPFFVGSLIALALCGIALGSLHRSFQHAIEPRRFFNYAAFCLLQQVALNSYLMNRLITAFESPVWAAIFSGVIFGALHWPNPVLVPLTFLGGAAMCWMFAEERNILPLALIQAILGTTIWWAFPLAWHHGLRVGPGFYSFHM